MTTTHYFRYRGTPNRPAAVGPVAEDKVVLRRSAAEVLEWRMALSWR